jgi:hypothetical protein
MRDEPFTPIAFATGEQIFLAHLQQLHHFFDDSLRVPPSVIVVGLLSANFPPSPEALLFHPIQHPISKRFTA